MDSSAIRNAPDGAWNGFVRVWRSAVNSPSEIMVTVKSQLAQCEQWARVLRTRGKSRARSSFYSPNFVEQREWANLWPRAALSEALVIDSMVIGRGF